jgi:hypothetical protein
MSVFYGTPSIRWQYAIIAATFVLIATVESIVSFAMGLL